MKELSEMAKFVVFVHRNTNTIQWWQGLFLLHQFHYQLIKTTI